MTTRDIAHVQRVYEDPDSHGLIPLINYCRNCTAAGHDHRLYMPRHDLGGEWQLGGPLCPIHGRIGADLGREAVASTLLHRACQGTCHDATELAELWQGLIWKIGAGDEDDFAVQVIKATNDTRQGIHRGGYPDTGNASLTQIGAGAVFLHETEIAALIDLP